MTDPKRTEAPAGGRRRRHDPGRRERIAAAAGVPLGSMTYHFSGMDELLHEAFTLFSRSVMERFEQRMASAADRGEAARAVVAIATDDVFATRRDLVLTHELYALAARDPAYRDLANAWMSGGRAALERHFDPTVARLLDALIEGLTIHRALDTEPQDPAPVRAAVDRLVPPLR
ncbi:TetR/AcrR family transcriptional regulator [Nocardiopsis composta]|uniref:DNA-binding transcriptional regulator YbjK n=1 Tax=Nocardiopsis composta TaxID=157465 RepID=A0A7W8VCM3_9ACTN|nr:TetR family transcriptional regulator [Nocardiopsis composta]MBB5431034.1 DNA-binding transcriptional regulator YbjK [Nocardiopsis composta]